MSIVNTLESNRQIKINFDGGDYQKILSTRSQNLMG